MNCNSINTSNGESLVGIVYMKSSDILPICVYGYPYDLSLFTQSITQVPSDIFYYS